MADLNKKKKPLIETVNQTPASQPEVIPSYNPLDPDSLAKNTSVFLDKLQEATTTDVTPANLADYNEQKKEARQALRERLDKGDILDLANMIGQSLARYGAAKEGLAKGVDMSKLDLGKGYTSENLRNRAEKEFQLDVDSAQSLKDTADQAYQEAVRKQQAAIQLYGQRANMSQAQLNALREYELNKQQAAENARANKAAEAQAARELAQNERAGRGEKDTTTAGVDALQKSIELNTKLANNLQQKQDAYTVGVSLKQEYDTAKSDKDRKDAAEKLRKHSIESGIPITTFDNLLYKTQKVKGFFGESDKKVPRSESEVVDAVKALPQYQLLESQKVSLNNAIQEGAAKLNQGTNYLMRNTGSSQATNNDTIDMRGLVDEAPTAPAPANKGEEAVPMRTPGGKIVMVPIKDVERAKTTKGFKEVPTQSK